ncbi:MAG TPA: GNAT family N-acetyltransferase [Acidimicrobiales bacterium]|nr:GNAT family N-acetyltransferase [Acidimicrobiales bacterium]
MATAGPDTPAVRLCGPDEVLALRQAVLRPHQSLEEVRFSGDLAPDAAHFCARGLGGEIVSIASVWPEVPPWCQGTCPAWRLRAMATVPTWRGKGVGSAVLAAAMSYVREKGGGLFWCNARLKAAGFYERAGMSRVGEPWEEPVIGPHVVMSTVLEPYTGDQ